KQVLNSIGRLADHLKMPDLRELYVTSFSTRTVVYKGLLLAPQVESFYDDLRNPLTVSALALVHQRFSTNTFPSWRLAHPYRFICHNGEINTVRGNVNWMAARRQAMSSELLGADLAKMVPLIGPGQSDTACIDNALELLVIGGGYSLAHSMMMLIPEAWSDPLMDPERRAFYEYHAALMEPWDGPAAIAFTDGRQIGATLDRNGLRPARYIVTDDDHVIMASEAGVLPVPEEKIVRKWRLQPGKMLLIDLEEGRIIDDAEIKQKLAAEHPYEAWLKQTQWKLGDLPDPPEAAVPAVPNDPSTRLDQQQAFGYTQEDFQFFLEPMARDADDPVGSMGTDTPIAAFSDKPKLLYNYFKQNFAQVTNPPIDPIREELVMSLISMIGPRPNLLGHEVGTHHRLEVTQPILTDRDLAKIRNIERLVDGRFKTDTLDITWPAAEGAAGIATALDRLCREATAAVEAGHNILILSDRAVSSERVPIPALLATSAVHHHLIRQGQRTKTGIVVETGEAREVHHFCVLAGYGAEAINPYLAFATIEQIRTENGLPLSAEEVQKNYRKALGKGILKVISKMGISTYQSYCGAQIFDAVGLQSDFVEKYFTGTATTIEGADLTAIAEEALVRHARAFGDDPLYREMLDLGGDYAFRLRGEAHAWTPQSVAKLQHAVRGNSLADYKAFAASINDQSERLLTIRGLMRFRSADQPLPLDAVEPAANIVRRFATGAMSFGSISREAHTTLA
ncbi:MAG TPA: glutamate synthase central domain-containing protein, partial [Reyranella sp.]